MIKEGKMKKTIKKLSKIVKADSSYESELMAIHKAICTLTAMQQDGEILTHSKIKVMSDNKSAVELICSQIKNNCTNNIIIYSTVIEYEELQAYNEVELKWIRRTKNKDADRASKIKNHLRSERNIF